MLCEFTINLFTQPIMLIIMVIVVFALCHYIDIELSDCYFNLFNMIALSTRAFSILYVVLYICSQLILRNINLQADLKLALQFVLILAMKVFIIHAALVMSISFITLVYNTCWHILRYVQRNKKGR